jgi:hypothetical protein
MKWMCLLMFGTVGLCAFAGGLGWGFKRWKLSREGVKTTGLVVDTSESLSSNNDRGQSYKSTAYYPEVEFTTPDGQKHHFRGSTGSGSPEYEKGQRVSLIYSRTDPANAQLAEFEQFWLGPAAITLFGFLFLCGGIGGFFLVSDSDHTFGPAFEATMARAQLYEGKRGVALPAIVKLVRQDHGKYVLVCSGGVPGAASRDFSTELAFDPGQGVVGKSVTVYADPQNAASYYVHVEPLFGGGKF